MDQLECLKTISSLLPEDALVAATISSTTAMWYSLRQRDNQILELNMGFSVPLGLGMALSLPHRKVVVLAGDGDLLLGLPILTDLPKFNVKNLTIVVVDNGGYMSGEFPTSTAFKADLTRMALGAGVTNAKTVKTLTEVKKVFSAAMVTNELNLIVCKVTNKGFRLPPSAPAWTQTGVENVIRFQRYIEKSENVSIFKPVKGAARGHTTGIHSDPKVMERIMKELKQQQKRRVSEEKK